jgi:hypothetical protein
MKQIAAWALAACIPMVAVAAGPAAGPDLTAAQIVEKNVAARGGLEAWRKIQTMVWVGHIERANAPAPSLPFVLEQQRPNRTRFEVRAENQMSVRVYDGTHGWKLRPASNGRPGLQAFTAEELNYAHDAQVIDGPLMDYAAKGVAVTLEGSDEVEGRKAYRLSAKLPSGMSYHVWIDAETFLDTKYDHSSRNAPGRPGTATVFYRNYRNFEGLQIPLTIETGAAAGNAMDRMVIDKIALNPPLPDRIFAKPSVPGARRNAVSVDTTSQARSLTVPSAR